MIWSDFREISLSTVKEGLEQEEEPVDREGV